MAYFHEDELGFVRFTTPTFTLTVPVDLAIIDEVRILFRQPGKDVKLVKLLADCTQDDGTLVIKLTQEETGMFEAGEVKLFVRFKTAGKDVLPSIERNIICHDAGDNEVM